MSRTPQTKELQNTRLANHYGGWIYCEGCQKTIGYLCYVTYASFAFRYQCKCGSCGSIRIAFPQEGEPKPAHAPLIVKSNRLCCPEDGSPLFTVLSKNLASYDYQVVCEACHTAYTEEKVP